MPESDLALLIRAAEAAGEVALGFWRADPKVWDKGDNDPVTEADIAANDAIQSVLLDARPEYGWLSEETPDGTDRLEKSRVFIVDPIDGTRGFVEGQATWAHSIAVVENGVVTAGAIFLPARERLYAAALGQGATMDGAPMACSTRSELAGAKVYTNKAAFDPAHWTDVPDEMTRSFRPSLAYRMAACGAGQADVMLTLRDAWEWDIAAGALIAAEAGATVTDRNGKPIVFNQAHPKAPGVIAAPSGLHKSLMSRRSFA